MGWVIFWKTHEQLTSHYPLTQKQSGARRETFDLMRSLATMSSTEAGVVIGTPELSIQQPQGVLTEWMCACHQLNYDSGGFFLSSLVNYFCFLTTACRLCSLLSVSLVTRN